MPQKSEQELVQYFKKILIEIEKKTGTHPWLCKEGYGNAFLVWGVK